MPGSIHYGLLLLSLILLKEIEGLQSRTTCLQNGVLISILAASFGGHGFDSLSFILTLTHIFMKEIEGLESCNTHIQIRLMSRVLCTWLGGTGFDSPCIIITLTYIVMKEIEGLESCNTHVLHISKMTQLVEYLLPSWESRVRSIMGYSYSHIHSYVRYREFTIM